ncbi:unnamed protein product [Symbiodinium natans]|uniref:Uncharacterized protein n=1 Tax=Symbiodinium natans TaxID=878477 RepID=A0A812P0K2_9DINO|nr:unnamed protein product [Symbiodinium natans]
MTRSFLPKSWPGSPSASRPAQPVGITIWIFYHLPFVSLQPKSTNWDQLVLQQTQANPARNLLLRQSAWVHHSIATGSQASQLAHGTSLTPLITPGHSCVRQEPRLSFGSQRCLGAACAKSTGVVLVAQGLAGAVKAQAPLVAALVAVGGVVLVTQGLAGAATVQAPLVAALAAVAGVVLVAKRWRVL